MKNGSFIPIIAVAAVILTSSSANAFGTKSAGNMPVMQNSANRVAFGPGVPAPLPIKATNVAFGPGVPAPLPIKATSATA